MSRAPLSPVEQQVYHFLLDFLAEHTFQPSVREIAQQFRIPSTKSVADILASLERKGYVKREAGRSRGVTLTGYAGGMGTVPVPVMRVEAGHGTSAAEDYLTLDRRLLPAEDAFLVRTGYEAAPAHGVLLGDLALVHPSARARDGSVVVVRAGGHVVVRTMQRRGATLILEAPGAGEPITLNPGEDFAVLGVLAGVVRTETTMRA